MTCCRHALVCIITFSVRDEFYVTFLTRLNGVVFSKKSYNNDVFILDEILVVTISLVPRGHTHSSLHFSPTEFCGD